MSNANNSPARLVKVSTKFGDKSVMTTLNPTQAAQVIQAHSDKASGFALDLVSKSTRWGLSPKQVDWLIFLAQEMLDKANKPAVVAAPVVSDVKPLFTLFGQARLNLKYPRLRLQDANGRLVVIKLSGSGSKFCGSLNITNGEKFGDTNAVFYGYVHQDGSCTIKDQGVLDLLKSLGNDPAGVAASQGLASGDCCCCGKALSDSEAGSSAVGYGPTCAKNWGLPWQANGAAPVAAPAVTAVTPVKKTRKPRKAKTVVELVAGSEVALSVAETADAYLAELNA